jgi:hypothetical protein
MNAHSYGLNRGRTPAKADLEEKNELMGKMDWIITGLMKSGLLKLDVDRGSANIAAIYDQAENQVNRRPSFSSARPRGLEDNQDSKETPAATPQDPFFEAYFIAPQAISRDLPDGVFGITDKSSTSYTTLMLDTSLNLSSLRSTLLEAESRGHPKSQMKRIEQIFIALPQGVMEQLLWLLQLRHEHSNKVAWDIVEIVKMGYYARSGQAGTLGTSSTSDEPSWGYLIVLRGQVGGLQVVLDIQKELLIRKMTLRETVASMAERNEAKKTLREELERMRINRLEATQSDDTQLLDQIERAMVEKAAQLQDLDSVVVQQEANVEAITEHIVKGHEEISNSMAYARRRRRMKWLFFPLVPLVWAVSLAVEKLEKIGTKKVSGFASPPEEEVLQPSEYVDDTLPDISQEEGERILDDFLSTFTRLE